MRRRLSAEGRIRVREVTVQTEFRWKRLLSGTVGERAAKKIFGGEDGRGARFRGKFCRREDSGMEG